MMGPAPAWWAVAVLLALAQSAAGRFVVEKNSVSVTSPEALKGKYECAIGNFGVPQYGGTLQGWVVYPKTNRQACKEFDTSFKSHKSGERPNFVLIDRGGYLSVHSYTSLLAAPAACGATGFGFRGNVALGDCGQGAVFSAWMAT